MHTGKVLLGLLVGLSVGAALGILFAPDTGSSTRKKIRKKGNDYSDAIGKKSKIVKLKKSAALS